MALYVTKQRLVELIQMAQAGDFTSELVDVVYNIAEGLHKKYHYTIDLEDYRQNAVLLVLKKVHRIDTSREVFCYLTTTVRNEANCMIRKLITTEQKMAQLGEKLKSDAKLPESCNRSYRSGVTRVRRTD